MLHRVLLHTQCPHLVKQIPALALGLILAGCAPTTETVDIQPTLEAAIEATWSQFTQEAHSTQPTSTATPTPTDIPTPTPTPTVGIGSQRRSLIDGMLQLFIPEGEFLMGSPDGDPDVFAHERPQHSVWLDAFWIDQVEVTNAMYAQCVAAGACTPPRTVASNTRTTYYGNPAYDAYPVVWVDWSQARAYCQWSGRRLPTEAEWEKAARGMSGQYYPWGDQPVEPAMSAQFSDISTSCARAHYAGCEPFQDTDAVGVRPAGASPYGALDMAGNVWEWVSDWYGADYFSVSPERNPQGPDEGTQRVLRGGSFAANFSRNLRAAHRYPMDPEQTIHAFGFRCAETHN